jgi:FAD/FMN-containing dehydrogenase
MPAFEPYFDPQDLSACVAAGTSAAAINAQAGPQGCAWPLWLDPLEPLDELFLRQRATSRSFRYGAVGDNVLGLQWRLPNGAVLGLGGRVVKNVAGFDLVRFLAGSQGRLGRPLRLVLRLRPQAQAERVLALRGGFPALKALARTVRASSWAHAIDALDLQATAAGGALHLSLRARPDLLPALDAHAQRWAGEAGAQLEALPELPAAALRPFAQAQAPVDEMVDLAQAWLEREGGSVHGFLGQGLLQLISPADPAAALRALPELQQRLGAAGGHVEHPSLPADPAAPQARWEAELLRRLESLA